MMENYQLSLLENLLYVSMISKIDNIAVLYRNLKFDFNNEGTDIKDFAESQKIFVRDCIIKPTRQKIDNYIEESLQGDPMFTSLKERLKIYSRSLEKKYFPEIDGLRV